MKHMIVWALAAILCMGFAVGCKNESKETMSTAPEAKEAPMFPESTVPPAEAVKPAPAPVDTGAMEPAPAPKPAPKESYAEPKAGKTYTIAKGDTLQKISDKFYGTTKKWKKILDANKDVIKDEKKLKPGTKIKIPPA